MRHPRWCLHPQARNDRQYLLDTRYLVHDFAAYCKSIHQQFDKSKCNAIRTVFVDMGASLNFDFHKTDTPVMSLLQLYRRYGFVFDHVYAFELKTENPMDVFAKVPRDMMASYHWVNVGVDTNRSSILNPWSLLLENFSAKDFVVVKLDVDNGAIELELLRQLLDDEHEGLAEIVDVLYFEHHVSLKEWFKYDDSVEKSLQLFHSLRERGIHAHYWV
jgi:hypothetical protein